MKIEKEREYTWNTKKKNTREYKNYNNYSYIYIYLLYIIYILTTSSKKTYEAYEVVFGTKRTRIRVCYTCVYDTYKNESGIFFYVNITQKKIVEIFTNFLPTVRVSRKRQLHVDGLIITFLPHNLLIYYLHPNLLFSF